MGTVLQYCRAVAITAFALLAGTAMQSCEGTTYTCEGIPVDCNDLSEEVCSEAPGCSLVDVPACQWRVQGCSGWDILLTPNCPALTCAVVDNRCQSICVTFNDERSCLGAGRGCVWSGNRCTTECSLMSGRDECRVPGKNCYWSSCRGAISISCASYSEVTCPLKYGCELKPHYKYSTQ